MDPPPPPPISTTTQATDSLNSLNSSPRSKPPSDSHQPTNSPPKLRLMCSFGGHIVPRPHDKSLCYVGGDTRIVVVDRNASLIDLISKISKSLISNVGSNGVLLKYQLPSEDLDSLISITTDEDLENMVEEYDRLNSGFSGGKGSRIRLFLFPGKVEMSGSSIGSLFGSEVKSEDWFLNALNGGSSLGGLSGSNSVNSLLGLNDDGGVGKLGVIGKNVDGFSGVEVFDRNSSFGSDVHLSGLGNLGAGRVKEENVGKGEEGGFVGSEVGKVGVDVNVGLEKVVGDNVGKGLSDDEKSEHGGTGYRRQLQQQQQAQVVNSQLNQKSSGGGGRDLASPDSVSSDGSMTNPLSRQRPMMYQDPNVQYAPVQSRIASNPVEQKITDSRIQMQQQYQDSGYMLPTQFDPHLHPQLQQPQFIRAGSQYIQHLPVGAVPMPAYYPVYSSQQPQHSHHPAVEQQYPVYYVPARQTQAYSMPVQHADYSEAAGAAPSNRPQAAPSAAMAPPSSGQYSIASNATVPKSEVPASLYRTANTAPPSVVQVPPGQPRPQYVGFSQIHNPQSSNPTPATATSYAYEFADSTQPHVYYGHHLAPQMAAQYQTMTSAAPQMAAQYQTMTSAAPETTAQLPADSTKQVRTSQL
ncbi:Developmental and secondary metabolism regulator veA like [Heracleum sosnowskyi]|uniref:Developmental and secondary metabolism regulator veA like n=1 Tax=Heracleum sosnowskyi TaxID=360622 RepID=A0AAD8I9A1_9APIA|nr:Developmental and secondary metabolism regulator veA like [Heracleum sosnowskyi]